MSRLIVAAALAWLAWDAWRAVRRHRRRQLAQHLLVPPTHRLPVPTDADLDRLWALVRDARDGDVQ